MKKAMVLASAAAAIWAAGCANAPAEKDPGDWQEAAMAAAGKEVFRQCRACHSLDPSLNTFGPRLHGIVGRPAGSVPRFAYSDAVRNSGVIWTEDNLRRWIADNTSFIPGTRMRHVRITDLAEQDYLLAFLKTLK